MEICINQNIHYPIEEIGEYRGVPAISAVSDVVGLADLIEEKVCEMQIDELN